jgi:hypothetical protein
VPAAPPIADDPGGAVPLTFATESTRATITFGQINMLLVVLIFGGSALRRPNGVDVSVQK